MKPRKWRLDRFEDCKSSFERFRFSSTFGKNAFYDMQDQAFTEVHHVRVGRVRDLGLDHPKLGQVPARLGFLRSKCRAESVRFAERGSGRFVMKLAGLC